MGGPLDNALSSPIGIISGGGTLPAEVAASIVRRGGRVHIIDVNGAADAAVHAYPRTVLHWSKLGRAVKALRDAGVRDVVMLGTFARPLIWKARPDLAFLKELPAILTLLRAGGDDALLRCLIAIFERQGFRIIGSGDAAPDLLVAEGVLTRSKPNSQDSADIETGFRLIDALGPLDIGQAAVISDGAVIAIEAAEGTDGMLRRVAARRGAGDVRGGVLVKRPKRGQDLRIDLPAIGPSTASGALGAKLNGIAVMAGQVLAAERGRLIETADAAGVFVAGVAPHGEAKAYGNSDRQLRQAGRVAIPGDLERDIANGLGAAALLEAFGAGSAVVVRSGRVLAVGARESAEDAIRRGRAYMRRRGRNAVAVLAKGVALTPEILDALDADRFAGVVLIAHDGGAPSVEASFLAKADERRQFIAVADIRAGLVA